MGASGTPLDLSWRLPVAAVPMELSCGHKSQKRQRTLHTVLVGIEGDVGITGIILGVIIIILESCLGSLVSFFGVVRTMV